MSHRGYAAFASVLVAAFLYCALGALQAAMLFVGAKALKNWSLWSSLALLSLVGACWLFRRATVNPRPLSRTASIVLSIAAGALSAYALHSAVSLELAADRCLDSGGSFDYANQVCSHVNNQFGLTFLERSGLQVTSTLVFGMLALAFGVRARRNAP